MVSATFLAKLNKEKINKNKYIFRTISGEAEQNGIVFLKLKIFKIEKTMRFFVVTEKHFKYDLLLGLDCVKEFRLYQDHNLVITQFMGPQTDIPNINTQIKINWDEVIPFEEFEAKIAHLDKNKQAEIERLLDKYELLFAGHRYDIGKIKNYEARIELLENRYTSQKKTYYRCSFPDQEEIEKLIKALLEHDLIEESHSLFASPVTLPYKKENNGEKHKTRLCIDFRELNKIIILPETYPFPLIDDLILKIKSCTYVVFSFRY